MREGSEGFYRDFGVPEVEQLARAIARKRGFPDGMFVPESGYPSSRGIPVWWKFQETAQDYLAMREFEDAKNR